MSNAGGLYACGTSGTAAVRLAWDDVTKGPAITKTAVTSVTRPPSSRARQEAHTSCVACCAGHQHDSDIRCCHRARPDRRSHRGL